MRVVLAEKPSVARELASFLGATQRHDGYYEGRGYQVTWALGHLVTLKEPQDYGPALKVKDRPSRLFSAQQEPVQRFPGWDWIFTFVVAEMRASGCSVLLS